MSSPSAFFRDVEELAKFCAVLVREGIMFRVEPASGGFNVEMTGF